MGTLEAFVLLDILPRALVTLGLGSLSGWLVVTGLRMTRT
jgi:hypothetical protein